MMFAEPVTTVVTERSLEAEWSYLSVSEQLATETTWVIDHDAETRQADSPTYHFG